MDKLAYDFATIDAAFDEIIIGSGVHRSRHELTIDHTDLTKRFQAALNSHRYLPTTVGAVEVQPGERVPAFYIDDSTAYFGWVFWEKFTPSKLRKLWGSVVRNKKGDWAIQLSPGNLAVIFANSSLKTLMDIENPR